MGATKICPVCRGPLGHGSRGDLPAWECPAGHGVGIDIVEAYGHLQLDELQAIWAGADKAPASNLASPIDGTPMATVTFVADDDLEDGNVGLNAQNVTIELDVANHFAWFSLEEIVAMPKMPATGGPQGMVGVSQLDKTESRYDNIFEDAENYQGPEDDDSAGRLNGFLGGLSRRLRS